MMILGLAIMVFVAIYKLTKVKIRLNTPVHPASLLSLEEKGVLEHSPRDDNR